MDPLIHEFVDHFEDENGNKAFVKFWDGSHEKAKASLLTLYYCSNMTNCSYDSFSKDCNDIHHSSHTSESSHGKNLVKCKRMMFSNFCHNCSDGLKKNGLSNYNGKFEAFLSKLKSPMDLIHKKYEELV